MEMRAPSTPKAQERQEEKTKTGENTMNRRIQLPSAFLGARGVLACLASSASVSAQPTTRPNEQEWKLVWNDEFDGDKIDQAKWGFDIGNGFKTDAGFISGWGNNELE